ncbi:MAG: hypothetical protein HC838_11760 [Spirulinaceae cyanobacterium RM2_2_10]|nr:hypothetical protein [Spirulinaceae cyanobacterium SM2_1_0]NJO20575.1 hypothetical protein [Spirulinaceae cyanobacterium RM2_2_10]
MLAPIDRRIAALHAKQHRDTSRWLKLKASEQATARQRRQLTNLAEQAESLATEIEALVGYCELPSVAGSAGLRIRLTA